MQLVFLTVAILLSMTVIGAPTADIGHYVKIFDRENCMGTSSRTTLFPGDCVDAPAGRSILVAHAGNANLVGWSDSSCQGGVVHEVAIGMACYNLNGVHTGSWSVLA